MKIFGVCTYIKIRIRPVWESGYSNKPQSKKRSSQYETSSNDELTYFENNKKYLNKITKFSGFKNQPQKK